MSHRSSFPSARTTPARIASGRIVSGRRRWWTAAAVAALAGSALFGAARPAGAAVTPATSNWAGYAATGSSGAFTSVSADWTQPTAHCGSGTDYADFWVGLDGYTSDSVEQAGTELDCSSGAASYYAWYELYPNPPVYLSNTIKPGDAVAATVSYAGSNQFTITIADTTRGWSQTATKTETGAARSSAEIITQAAAGTGTLPTTLFHQVSYTGAMVNKAGLCKSDPIAGNAPGLTVSAITNCTNFTVTQT